jgi:hypothetical protein
MNRLPKGSSGMTAISAETTIASSPAVRLPVCRSKTVGIDGSKAQTGAGGSNQHTQIPCAHLLVVLEPQVSASAAMVQRQQPSLC